MAKTSASEWARRVARLEASGLSAVEFGRRERIDAQQLRWWKWHLAQPSKAALRAPSAVSFAPVVVQEQATAGPLEVVLRDGHAIRVHRGFDEETFLRVVALLEDATC